MLRKKYVVNNIYILYFLFLLTFNFTFIETQQASSNNYLLRSSEINDGASPKQAGTFKIESTSFGAILSIGESFVSSSNQVISSSYKSDIGHIPTWNLPPKIITNLVFPENDRYLYTSKPPMLFGNAGDWDYSGFQINDKLNFELQISTNNLFSTTVYSANTRSSIYNWFITTSPNECLFSATNCSPFPTSGTDSNFTGSIKHIVATDLSVADYYWKVKAFDDFEFSEDSSKPLFHYLLPVVSTNTPVNNEIINASSVVLSWSTTLGANRYQVQISRSCDFTDAVDYFIDVPSLSLMLSSLEDGRYCWRIRPLDILGNPSNYTATLIFYIVTIPVLGVRLISEFYVIPPETEVLLSAYLLGPQDKIVPIFSLSDIDISITGRNPPGDPGVLFNKRLFSDRIEITYKSPLGSGFTSIRATEMRSGDNFQDNITIGSFGRLILLEGKFNPRNIVAKVGEETLIANIIFWAVSENIKLNDLYIALPPTKNAKILRKLRFVEDVNNDGKFTDGVDRLVITIDRGEFDPNIVILPKIRELLPRNVPINYLLLGTFSQPTSDGDFYIDFVPENAGNAWGVISNTIVPIEGISFRAGPISVKSTDKTFFCKWNTGFANFSSREFTAPILNLQGLYLLVSSLDKTCTWHNPVIRISGTGIDNVDITKVSLVEDANADGMFDSSDIAIATGIFSRDDGTLTFPVTISLNPFTTRYFFVLIDITNASNNAYYKVYTKKADQQLIVNGSSSAFSGSDFLYGTLLTKVDAFDQGFVNIITNPQFITQKILQPNKTNSVMSFTFYNSNLKEVRFSELKIVLVIDPLYTSFIKYANLYLDINKNGIVETQTDLLVDRRLFIPEDGAQPWVKFSGFDIGLNKNEYKSFAVSFDITQALNVKIHMRALIESSGSVVITGSPVAKIDGLPVSSHQLVLDKSTDVPPPPENQIISSGGVGGGGCFVQPYLPRKNTQSKHQALPPSLDLLFMFITLLPLIYIVFKLYIFKRLYKMCRREV